jgi:hypothetical protein
MILWLGLEPAARRKRVAGSLFVSAVIVSRVCVYLIMNSHTHAALFALCLLAAAFACCLIAAAILLG